VSLDHQHVLDRFHHPWRLVEDFAVAFALARAVVRGKTPRCHRYLVVSFHVYGYGATGRAGNVELLPFDELSFLKDLAAARAVVSNGGFTAISEALYFGKPVLSIPLEGQAEQQLNAAWLAELGLGIRAPRADATAIRRFLEVVPALKRPADPRLRSGTRDALTAVDQMLAEVA
jgi:hypothetical protein